MGINVNTVCFQKFTTSTSEMRNKIIPTEDQNHYITLNIPKTATQSQIKESYYRLSQVHHPDQKKGNVEKFRQISEAYDILGDSAKKKSYDEFLESRLLQVVDKKKITRPLKNVKL